LKLDVTELLQIEAHVIAVENFHMLQQRQTTDTVADPASRKARVNLLNWDGKGAPDGLFPPRTDEGKDT
jgi:nitrate reductase beta subunit